MNSCQPWPPSASGTRPAALSLSSAAKNSSELFGSPATPAFWSAAFEYQNQVGLWMLTGTA